MNVIIDAEALHALRYIGYSFLLGLALGAVKSCFSLLKALSLGNTVVDNVADFFFWLVAGLSVFLLALSQNFGMVRAYSVLGALFGLCVYLLSLGRAVEAALEKLAGRLDSVRERAAGALRAAARKTGGYIKNRAQAVKKTLDNMKNASEIKKKQRKSTKNSKNA